MKNCILIHDLGTSGNKASLFDETGQLVKSEVYPYSTHYFHDVCAEQDAEDWWEAVVKSSNRLLKGIEPGQIAAVSFSGQMQGCLCVDDSGRPLHPSIIWSDQRATEETCALTKVLTGRRVYEITGHRASPVYSIEKLMWMQKHWPGICKKTAKVLNAKDYIIFQLTGEFITDYSDASGTNGFDITRKKWSEEILQAAGIHPSLLPDTAGSSDIAGYVTVEAAAVTGIAEGTPVICGGGDGACAAVGAGSIREGQAYICMGTSAWIASASRRPILGAEMELANFIHLVPDTYMPCGSTSSCGNVFNWAIDTFENAKGKTPGVQDFDKAEKLIAGTPRGSGRLVFLPYLTGERAPIWDPHARGAFVGLSLNHGKAEMYRAVMEGITLNLERILQAVQQACSVSSLHLIGGSENETWNRMMADIFYIPVLKITNSRHATSIGAAVAAGVGIGLYDDFSAVERFMSVSDEYLPDPAGAAEYEKIKPVFKDTYDSLKDIFSKLTSA